MRLSKNSAGSVTSTSGSSTASTGTGSPGAAPTTVKLNGSGGSNFCDIARQDQNAFGGANVSSLTAADLKKEFENIGPALQHAADIAPHAIKSDFEVFINAFAPYLKALANANSDFTKIKSSSLQAASQHIVQYLSQVCHITTRST